MNTYEQQYLDLMHECLSRGVRKPTRAKLESTGEHIDAYSLFGRQLRFDLSQGFPAITTKRLFFRGVVAELLWMLSGSTNVRVLQEQNVHIWDQWADETGEVGPSYGKQMRAWPAPRTPRPAEVVRLMRDCVLVPSQDEALSLSREIADLCSTKFDQIENLVRDIRAVKEDPTASVGRRLIMSLWNVADIPRMRLPPCHCFSQFMVTNGRLSCQLYQRSGDVFLGVPFNIAQYALLTHLLAQVTGLEPGELVHTFGDVHLYANHVEQARTQISRIPREAPRLVLDPSVTNIDDFRAEHIKLDGYESYPALPGEVAV